MFQKSSKKKRKGSGGLEYPLVFKSVEEWAESSIPYELRGGPSPGGAASDLGVTRQTIWNWGNLGLLDRITIEKEPNRRYGIEMISRASVTRVRFVLDQLRAEWETTGVKGRDVSGELARRLPQLDIFLDVKAEQK